MTLGQSQPPSQILPPLGSTGDERLFAHFLTPPSQTTRYNSYDMRSLNFSTPKVVAALTAAAVLSVPALALAQPNGEQETQPPSYAQPAQQYANHPGITGTISGFDGQWVVYMHDDKGYTDHITLHQGTIINPTGIRLNEGMKVTVYGNADGPTFQANRIDVAYSPYSPYYGSNGQPAYGAGGDFYGYGGDTGYGYGGGGYGYGGYGGYGYGGYGGYPAFGLGVNWGWGWGWGWPGFWGWWGWPNAWGWWGGWPGYGGFYGGYPYYPYRYGCCGFRGSGFVPGRHGQFGAPVSGRVQGGMRAPVSGGMSGGMHAPVSSGGGMRGGGGGGMRGGPPHR